jgi:hypothetical protein
LARNVNGTIHGGSLRDFELVVKHNLLTAKRTGRPLCAARLTVDMTSLNAQLGPRGAAAIRELCWEIALQNLRDCDISTRVEEGILICLPETDKEQAKAVVAGIGSAISAAACHQVNLKTELFDITQIGALVAGHCHVG